MHFRPSDASPMALRPRPGLCRGTFIVSIQKNNMSRVWGRMPPGTARALLGSRLAANRPLSITSSACALNPSSILKPLYSESPFAKLRPRPQSGRTCITWSEMPPASCRFTLKVLLQSFGLDHKATGLTSLGRKCNRHHAGLQQHESKKSAGFEYKTMGGMG